MKTKEKVLLKDEVVKKIFTGSKSGTRYLERIVSYALDIPLEVVKDNLELIHPEIGISKNYVNQEVDLVYENCTSYITIEFNYNYYKDLNIKNYAYICALY